MNPEKTSSQPAVSIGKSDSSKLVSLLALAAGAIALPQTSNADIFYTDLTLSPVTVGFGSTTTFVINNLPGSAQMRVHFGRSGATSLTSTRFVTVRENAGYLRLKTNGFFAARASAGMHWSQIAGNIASLASAGVARYSLHFPDGFSSAYYAFRFQDSTQGNALRYGWLNIGLSNDDLMFSDGPQLNIYGWAYDNTGAQIAMGEVPEPSSAALLALGALTFGSKGLRSWRRNRVNAGKS